MPIKGGTRASNPCLRGYLALRRGPGVELGAAVGGEGGVDVGAGVVASEGVSDLGAGEALVAGGDEGVAMRWAMGPAAACPVAQVAERAAAGDYVVVSAEPGPEL